MKEIDWKDHIEFTANGTFISGTKVRPLSIFKLFLKGQTESQIRDLYPLLSSEQIGACKGYSGY